MSGLRIHAKKGLLQFLIVAPPIATVDGREVPLAWGRETTVDAAGQVRVEISFRYMGRQCGKAEMTATAGDPPPLLRYKTPFLVTSRGSLRAG